MFFNTKELQQNKKINVKQIRSTNNFTDHFTKSFFISTFEKLTYSISMRWLSWLSNWYLMLFWMFFIRWKYFFTIIYVNSLTSKKYLKQVHNIFNKYKLTIKSLQLINYIIIINFWVIICRPPNFLDILKNTQNLFFLYRNAPKVYKVFQLSTAILTLWKSYWRHRAKIFILHKPQKTTSFSIGNLGLDFGWNLDPIRKIDQIA